LQRWTDQRDLFGFRVYADFSAIFVMDYTNIGRVLVFRRMSAAREEENRQQESDGDGPLQQLVELHATST
jgi:hypothetical protein